MPRKLIAKGKSTNVSITEMHAREAAPAWDPSALLKAEVVELEKNDAVETVHFFFRGVGCAYFFHRVFVRKGDGEKIIEALKPLMGETK